MIRFNIIKPSFWTTLPKCNFALMFPSDLLIIEIFNYAPSTAKALQCRKTMKYVHECWLDKDLEGDGGDFFKVISLDSCERNK